LRVLALRIPCRDLAVSERFYSRLLGRPRAFGSLELGYVGFELENVSVLLEPTEAGEFEVGRYLGFSLEVDDIQAFYLRLKDEVAFSGQPESQPWGGTMTHVTDVNGNTLSIVQVSA